MDHRFYVDNHAPGEAWDAAVVGGEGWHSTNDFTIDFDYADQGSGSAVHTAYYEVCEADVTNCFSGSQSGDGISQLSHLTVPAQGDYIVRIWLADGAGNVSSARTPATTGGSRCCMTAMLSPPSPPGCCCRRISGRASGDRH